MAGLGFVDEAAEPQTYPDPVPAGKYIGLIFESDVKPTKENTGEVLHLKHAIIDGPHENRTLTGRINLRNNNQQAQEIGQRQLASLRQATGVNSPKDSAEFHNIPVLMIVKVRPAGTDKKGFTRDYASNEVVGYEKLTAAPAPAQQQAPAPARQTYQPPAGAQRATTATMPAPPKTQPWKR